MSDFATDVHQNSVWSEYSRSLLDLRILVLEWLSFFLVSLLAVWITVWAPQYWKLLKQTLNWLDSSYRKLCNLRKLKVIANWKAENRPAEANRPQSAISEILADSRTAEEAIVALFQQLLKSKVGISFIAIFLCAVIFISIAGAGTAISFLILDSNTLSTSPNCGLWIPTGANDTANPMGAIMDAVESYYISCYESDPSVQSCGLFSDDDLYINYTDGVECHFGGDLCALGRYSAGSWDTGYLDSKVLGINSRHRPFFRRSSICAPIVTDGYYDAEFDNTTSFTSINFHYGSRIDINATATYSQTRSPRYEQIFSPSGYEIKTVSTNLEQFIPIKELQNTTGDTFLAFVNTFNLQYPETSNDPIFPATNSSPYSYSSLTCWKNSQLPASVLACTEVASVCTPDLSTCLDAFDAASLTALEDWTGAEEALLTHALDQAWIPPGRDEADCGNRVSQALDPEQWKVEVRRLFGMSVLRAKWEMLYAVRGTRAGDDGYVNELPESYRGVCGKFMFQVKGYKNVSFVGILVAVIVPMILGLECEETALIVWLLIGFGKLAQSIWKGIVHTSRTFWNIFTRKSNRVKSISPNTIHSQDIKEDITTSKGAEGESKGPAVLVLSIPLPGMSDSKTVASDKISAVSDEK